MPRLRAEENRYLLTLAPEETRLVRRIPGHRYIAPQKSWQFPRQPGVILAIDRVLGVNGWTPESDIVVQDAAEARQRVYPPPQSPADVKLDNGQLSVGCAINDRDLVKLVPGYRWSPAQKRWYVAAMPLALEILEDAFGDALRVDDQVRSYLELRRRDEERDRGPGDPPRGTAERTPVEPQRAVSFQPVRTETQAIRAALAAPVVTPATPPNEQWIGRLTEALERIEAKLDGLAARVDGGLAAAPVATPPAAVEMAAPHEVVEAAPTVAGLEQEDLWELVQTDPEEAFDRACRELQTHDESVPDASLRAVLGVAALRLKRVDDAFRALSRALERPLEDGSRADAAEAAYVETVLALINQDCGPEQPIETVTDFYQRLYDEIVDDAGFDDAAVASQGSRDTLDLLVNNRALARVSRQLSDYCRVAHLLASARAGSRLALERIEGVIGEEGLSPDSFALAVVLFANVLLGVKSANDWTDTWPGNQDDAPLKDGTQLVSQVRGRLDLVDPNLAAHTSLAVLRCIAAGPPEVASLKARRELLAKIQARWPFRQYAQFLAAFRLAATGEHVNYDESFPGYVKQIANMPLSASQEHLTEVFYSSNEGRGAARLLADNAYTGALKWGVNDPKAEVLDLLDFVAAGTRPHMVLNEVSRMVEDREVSGSERFSRAQRKQLYERTLAESVRMGYPKETREAFERLVRELQDAGADEELTELASRYRAKPKVLRVPALALLLEWQLRKGEAFEETVTELVNAARDGDEAEEMQNELAGLALLYPVLQRTIQKLSPEASEAEIDIPDLKGKRVVMVGGHGWLQKRARPVLDEWGVKVDWVAADEAERGRAIDLAKGGADVLLLNVRCIGHAGSGRVEAAAKSAGTRYVVNGSQGVGALLMCVRDSLSEEIAQAEVKPARAGANRRRRLLK